MKHGVWICPDCSLTAEVTEGAAFEISPQCCLHPEPVPMEMTEHIPLESALGARHLGAALDAAFEFERTMERVRLATGVDADHFEKFAAKVRRLASAL